MRRQFYPDDAAFGKAMREAGYVSVRTRKLTGKDARFWLYRVTGNDKGGVAAESAPHKASAVTVQASETERFAFKRVAVDGRYLWVYADHIHFLKKIRTRISGKQVQGYSARNVNFVIEGERLPEGLCPQKTLKNIDKMLSVQVAESQYVPDVLASMTPQDILTAAKNTLMQINATHGYGMMAHNMMLSHGGRNLASVPAENMAGCLVDLDKLLVVASTGLVEVLP